MEFYLAKRELLRLEGGRSGLTLYCTVGTLWLTKGDGVDHLIPAGRRILLERGETALVEALELSELKLGQQHSPGSMVKPVVGLAGC